MSPPQPDDVETSGLTFRAPTNHKEALFQAVKANDTRSDPVTASDYLRDGLLLVLQKLDRQDKLPEEARDLLNGDLVADAGEDADVSQEGADA